jgi:hypothetical protein
MMIVNDTALEENMLKVKGYYDGNTVTLERGISVEQKCEVIVTFFEPLKSSQIQKDDGSLAFLFQDYVDDRIREPLVDFGEAVGNEKW